MLDFGLELVAVVCMRVCSVRVEPYLVAVLPSDEEQMKLISFQVERALKMLELEVDLMVELRTLVSVDHLL